MEPLARPEIGRLALPALREMAASIPEIDHYELDGIPLFHMPAAGATILTLAFGVGRAHEPVIQSGMTHLAEHLILTAIDQALDHSNGSTEPFRVTFTIRASPGDASRFLRDVCDQIARPRLSRIHEEANVLRSEAAVRSNATSIEGRLNFLRVGYQGLGKVELPELFLRHLDPEVLREWIARHFVAGNAAIWILGQLPDDLYIALEPGPATPLPTIETIPGYEGPTMLLDEVGGVGASFDVEPSLAVQVALRTIEQHLKRALRVERGLGYAISAEYRPVEKDRAVAFVFASCLPEKVADVQRAMLETIDDVAARGPSEDEIADYCETFLRDASDPMAYPARLDRRVQDTLMGIEPTSVATRVDEMWRLQPDQVAAAFRAARETMLLLLPANAIPPNRAFKPYPQPPPGPLGQGQTFEFVPAKGTKIDRRRTPKLFVGAQGLTVDTPAGRYASITWTDCVAVIRDDYERAILARDGSSVVITPESWRNGYGAIALVDRYAPAAVVVR
ncbi:MAG: insulinase family protein [Chloroflexi bacterium]|nr:insulinase family protein [Chloroflexota bacterium]